MPHVFCVTEFKIKCHCDSVDCRKNNNTCETDGTCYTTIAAVDDGPPKYSYKYVYLS